MADDERDRRPAVLPSFLAPIRVEVSGEGMAFHLPEGAREFEPIAIFYRDRFQYEGTVLDITEPD